MSALRPLRILEIATSGTVGTPDMGPVSTTISALANGFARGGHSVTVSDRPSTKPRTSLDPRMDVVAVPVGNDRRGRLAAVCAVARRAHGWWDALRYLWSLRRALKLETFDVVHVHDEALACLLSLMIPRRYYYTSHTSVWALKREQGEKLSVGERLDAAIESFAICNSRATIALSDYLAPQVPGAFIETIVAMSLPVVASRTGGLAQTITDDVGLLVPPRGTQSQRTSGRRNRVERAAANQCRHVRRSWRCQRTTAHASVGQSSAGRVRVVPRPFLRGGRGPHGSGRCAADRTCRPQRLWNTGARALRHASARVDFAKLHSPAS